jgi:hypothetical protein
LGNDKINFFLHKLGSMLLELGSVHLTPAEEGPWSEELGCCGAVGLFSGEWCEIDCCCGVLVKSMRL